MRTLQNEGIPIARMRVAGYGVKRNQTGSENILPLKNKSNEFSETETEGREGLLEKKQPNKQDELALARKIVLVIEPEAER